MNHALKKVGIGIVIQETPLQGRRGPVIEQLAETFPASGIPASEIELFAILRAVEIAVSRGLQWVKIRSDCNQGRRKIKADVKNQHQGNSCTARGKILDLAKSIENLQIAYCPRRKNQMAHRLARMGAGIAPKSARKRETGLVGNVDSDDQ
jgi:ribonuclease HI